MDNGQKMTYSVGHRRRLWRWFAGLTAVILALQVAMLVPLIVTVAAITQFLTVWSWDRYRLRHPDSGGVDDGCHPRTTATNRPPALRRRLFSVARRYRRPQQGECRGPASRARFDEQPSRVTVCPLVSSFLRRRRGRRRVVPRAVAGSARRRPTGHGGDPNPAGQGGVVGAHLPGEQSTQDGPDRDDAPGHPPVRGVHSTLQLVGNCALAQGDVWCTLASAVPNPSARRSHRAAQPCRDGRLRRRTGRGERRCPRPW
jgi:hypothetical protein